MSILQKYSIEDPNLRDAISELEEMANQQSNVQNASNSLSNKDATSMEDNTVYTYSNKIFWKSGTKVYSLTGTEEA